MHGYSRGRLGRWPGCETHAATPTPDKREEKNGLASETQARGTFVTLGATAVMPVETL